MAVIRSFEFRAAVAADAEDLARIESASFADPSWKGADFLRYDCTVGVIGTKVCGFLVSRETFAGSKDAPPEREILNLAVAKEFRRRGLASLLLAQELKRATYLFLEVRESNVAALQLYKKTGFIAISRRLNYYDNPVESAIVMRMKW